MSEPVDTVEEGVVVTTSTAAAQLPIVKPENYAVDGEFARGGLGRILRARDTRLGRVVAIKELLPKDAASEARFVREALVTANLEHPGIVPIHEAGRWPSGQPFYAMKLVSGRSLQQVIKGTHTLRERLALLSHVIAVAEAIAYAHSRNVIHRDIKPPNVIVGQFGETVVIDWGLAKDLKTGAGMERDPAAKLPEIVGIDETIMGDIMGTPAYMPPEQARGEIVDERADVYALGALLYHVLCGSSPYSPKSETIEQSNRLSLAPTEHVNTTQIIAEVVLKPAVPVEHRQPDVPDELVTIVKKAMARTRGERYPTAKEFAEDLKRFQTGQLVGAHAYSAMALVRRWIRRNRAVVAVGSAALLVLIVAGVIALRNIVHARGVAEAERAEAVRQRTEADAQRSEAQAMRAQAEKRSNDLVLLQARASLAHDPTAALAWLKLYPLGASDWAGARAVVADAESRGVARAVWRAHGGSVNSIAISTDGQWLVSGSQDRTIRLWSLPSGRSKLVGTAAAPLQSVAFSPDGNTVASGGDDHEVVLWDVSHKDASSFPHRVIGTHDDEIGGVIFSPDGKLLATCANDLTVRIWDLAAGTSKILKGHLLAVMGVSFSPDGKWIASGSEDKTVRLWDVATGKARVLKATAGTGLPSFSPDGKLVASSSEKDLLVWDVATGEPRAFPKQPDIVWATAFSPDGKSLAASDATSEVLVWDLETGRHVVLAGHVGVAETLIYGPDGTLYSGGLDTSIRVWRAAPPKGRVLRGLEGDASAPEFSPDGKRLAAGSGDGLVRVWNVDDGGSRALTGHKGGVPAVAYAPDGEHVASRGQDGTVRIWNIATGDGRVVYSSPVPMTSELFAYMVYSPDGRWLAFPEGFDKLRVVDVARGEVTCTLDGHGINVFAFSPDGGQLAFGSENAVRMADPKACNTAHVIFPMQGTITTLGFSPDGAHLAAAGIDNDIRLWTAASGSLALLKGHTADVFMVRFSPDGQALASSSHDQTIRIWNVDGTPRRLLAGSASATMWLAWTPDGRTLASAERDKTLRIWDVASGEARVLRGHDDLIAGLAFSPDGKLLASSSHDATVRLWSIDTGETLPTEPRDLLQRIAAETSARIDPQNLPTSNP